MLAQLRAIGLLEAPSAARDLLLENEANLRGVKQLLNAAEDILGASIIDLRWLDEGSSRAESQVLDLLVELLHDRYK